MELIFILVPLCLLMGGGAVAAFVWAVRTGQFDDTTTPAWRILFDDEPSPPRPRSPESNQGNGDATHPV